MNTDIVLTGLPRSGSTLACELLNLADDTIALDEPMDANWKARGWRNTDNRLILAYRRRKRERARKRVDELGADALVERVQTFFDTSRASLLAGKGAFTKNIEGTVSGGKFADKVEASGLRRQVTDRNVVRFDKPLSPNFVLAVKHNSGFTAAIDALTSHFPVFATVRHPLSILSSWQTVPIPVNRGRAPRAEQLDPELHERLNATPDVVDRQFILLDWFFDRYRTNLDAANVIKYEDMVATGGRVLASVAPNASRLAHEMENRNRAKVYDKASMAALAERLLETDGAWREYYGPETYDGLLG